MRISKLLLLYMVFFAIALCGEKTDSLKTYTLSPNVTTGTRTEVSQANLPASVSVLSSVEIEQSGEKSIVKLVGDRIPGLFLTERGVLGYGAAQGAAGGISIRGVGGSPTNGVLVLIDGRPQFMGIFGHPFPDNYLSMNTERVEVIRGPASVLYGTNAMGGVVNIITKKNNFDGVKATLNSSYGTYNTVINDLGLGYAAGRLELFGSYNHSETEGHRDYTKFNINSGYGKAAYTFSEEYNVTADFNISKFRTFDPGTIYKPLINNWMEISRGSVGFAFNNTFGDFDGGLKFYYNWGENNVYDGWFSKDNNTNLLLYQNLKIIDNNITTVGIDYKHYGGEATNPKSGMFSKLFIEGKNFVDETGLYFLSQQYFSNKFVVNGGLRYENSSKFGDEIIPQIGMAFHVDDNNTVKAVISKGFRSPTVKDLFLFPVRNPDLKPEELWNYEIGFLNHVSDNISLETAFFIAKGDNIIVQQGVAPNAILKNAGSFSHKGVELLAKIIGSRYLNFTVSYTYLDPGDQTKSNPRHKFFAEANYSINNFDINFGLKQISKLYGDDYSRFDLPDYTLVSSRVSYSPLRFMRLFLSGDNLLNKSYQTIYGYTMPGRTYTLGINLSY